MELQPLLQHGEERIQVASGVPPHQQPPRSGQASGKLSQAFLDKVRQALQELQPSPREIAARNRYQFLGELNSP